MFSEEIVGKENQWKSELRERNQELCSILEQDKNVITFFNGCRWYRLHSHFKRFTDFRVQKKLGLKWFENSVYAIQVFLALIDLKWTPII